MRAALLLDPRKVDPREILALVGERCADLGWESPLGAVTTAEDGEPLGSFDTLLVEVEPAAIRVRVPR